MTALDHAPPSPARQRPHGARSPGRVARSTPARPTARPTAPAAPADALAEQLRTAVVQRAARGALLQRVLDEDFEHGGTPEKGEAKACRTFADKVSDFVDQAHLDLLGGNVSGWKGSKITAFLKLLSAKNPAARVHAGNVIEERVYALMKGAKMGIPWTAQFAEGMGGASRPDIVINLPSGNEALIDITSQRGHILGKAGAWCTSTRYVYVAEAWFPSVLAAHLPKIRKNIRAGGVTDEDVEEMIAEVERERRQRAEQRKQELAEARQLRNEYPSYAAFVREVFDGDRTAANHWMREHGMGTAKGVTRRKPRRTMDYAQKARKRKAAAAARRRKQEHWTVEAKAERREEKHEAVRKRRQDELSKRRAIGSKTN